MNNYSTLPKRWSSRGWVDIGSDVNWSDYHGMWGKRTSDGSWYVVTFTNMVDACGERDAAEMGFIFEAQLSLVDLKAVEPKTLQQEVKSFGSDFDDWEPAWQEEAVVAALASGGTKSPLGEWTSSSHPERIRAAAFAEAESLMRDAERREELLDRPVNRIGTTSREFGAGQFMAGLDRYCEQLESGAVTPDPTKDLMLKLSPPKPIVKQVQQKQLSGECWSVQVWGTDRCEDCEYKDTADCGGQEIRESGRNSKGIEIGTKGL